MTPKEKAKELFDKYYSNIPETGLQGKYSIFIQHAKKCALIAVDEILNAIIRKKYLIEIGEWIETSENNYWQQVRTEIEKL